jgi:hypothetical protein
LGDAELVGGGSFAEAVVDEALMEGVGEGLGFGLVRHGGTLLGSPQHTRVVSCRERVHPSYTRVILGQLSGDRAGRETRVTVLVWEGDWGVLGRAELELAATSLVLRTAVARGLPREVEDEVVLGQVAALLAQPTEAALTAGVAEERAASCALAPSGSPRRHERRPS